MLALFGDREKEIGVARELIVAIDQGTTGSTVVLMDLNGTTLARATCEFTQYFPAPGQVEHEPEEIWLSIVQAIEEALQKFCGSRERIAAIGIANQRETTLVWEHKTGRPVHRAIVWQDRRTAKRCAALKSYESRVKDVTGLVIDPYFSASKLQWILQSDASIASSARRGELRFGTMDSYIVERLRGLPGENEPIIEVTNASRTLLMNLRHRKWSSEMCGIWDIPSEILPTIVSSAQWVGRTLGVPGLPDGIPITGIAGDQHAALFGQGCILPGDAKCTYGTGAFVLVNTGKTPVKSEFGLLSTLAWQIGDEVVYALEGSSFVAGAAVQWLRDGLGIIEHAAEIETLARGVSSSEGVSFVPALTGLGAPHWDPEARGLISGISRGTTKAHLARATLEAIAFQVDDLLAAIEGDMRRSTGNGLAQLRVDGGASKNNLLLQLQADISNLQVHRPQDIESTARGAGMLAAIGARLLPGVAEAAAAFKLDKTFLPHQEDSQRKENRDQWEQAVARARLH